MAILTIGVGTTANDGSGDSIRLAFEKTNTNFAYLESQVQNLSTGNLSAGGTTGNISFNSGIPSYWTGTYYLNGFELATTNTTFGGGAVRNATQFLSTTTSTGTTSGALTVSGGLGVAGASFLSAVNAYSLTANGAVTASDIQSTTGTYTGVLQAVQITVGLSGGVGTITTAGNISTTTANVNALQGTFNQVQGTLLTNAQPYINSLGNLTLLNIAGNVNAGNLTANGTVQSGYLEVLADGDISGNLGVDGFATIDGNVTAGNVSASVGSFATATVNTFPSDYHVVNKRYVNNTALAFAIATGS
jgi:hypothetical protein